VVVGSATVKPGEMGTLRVSVIMHEGMGGPHLFHIFVKSSDPVKPVTVLKVKADIVAMETWRRSHPDAFYLPRNVGGFELLSESVGIENIPKSLKGVGYPGQLKNAYQGSYRSYKKETRLLVGEYSGVEEAKKNLSKMIQRLKKIPKGSDQPTMREAAGNAVYSFKRGAREHFYFQRANKVFLLFPDSSVAKQSLEDVLKHVKAL
jgi:hypothetical protein